MKRQLLVSLVAVMAALVAAPAPAVAIGAKINVVTTLPALASIVTTVGGESVSVTSLAYPNQDPHFVDARPNLILPLNRADLLVINGLDLETGWLPVLRTGARNANIQMGTLGFLDASTLVPLKGVPLQKIDRSMGDLHAGGNPHFLTDPRNGARIATGIAARLSQLLPRQAAAFKARAATFAIDANALGAKEAKRFASLPAAKRQVVGYHQSWIYLNDWLSLNQIGMIEPKPGVPPTPQHVAALLGQIRDQKVTAILQETYYPSRFGQLLAEKTHIAFVLLPGGPNFNQGETYLGYLTGLTSKIHDALMGKKP
ncbi:MAG: zinc ABC transporter substrate-binding protein [Candidatus Sericytochromatia bacterium]|nr:zinc ABC transporter substrate-binding protein [Candidatus Sericytochromatia bacterium]